MRAMPTRRILLKTTAKLAASSAFALNRATLARANLLGDAAAGTLPEVYAPQSAPKMCRA